MSCNETGEGKKPALDVEHGINTRTGMGIRTGGASYLVFASSTLRKGSKICTNSPCS